MKLAFIDTETTSLNRYTRQAWDIAYIIRDDDGIDRGTQFFVDVNLAEADPMSLKIGGYYERHPEPFGFITGSFSTGVLSPYAAAQRLASDLLGAIIIGAVPSFDEETLARLLRAEGFAPTWHYHLADIESMAAGHLGASLPWNFDAVLKSFGLVYDESVRHTAMGDAQMVRDLYDRIMGIRSANS